MNHSKLTVLGLGLAVIAAACSSSSSGSPLGNGGAGGSQNGQCNQDPWICPAGQTCWIADTQLDFQCMNSAQGKNKGDSCTNTIGHPTCGDAQICYMAVGSTTGICITYCDPTNASHACAANETCWLIEFNGSATVSVHACIPNASPDAGSDGSAGSGGAGGAGQAGQAGAAGATAGAAGQAGASGGAAGSVMDASSGG